MGTFFPALRTYNIKEMTNFNLEISYLDDLLQPSPVTISPSLVNDTINITGGSITGYYSNVFDILIKYRRPDYSYNETNSFEYITEDGIPLIYRFTPDGNSYFTYTYTVTANGESVVYTVNVLNDWIYQRNRLFQVVNPELFEQITVKWINNSSDIMSWENNIAWITETWPWHS